MKNLPLPLSSIFVVFFAFNTSAQEILQQKYEHIKENTETYKRYKVIPITDLDAFWSEVTDSLNQKQRRIDELRPGVADAKAMTRQAQAELSDVQVKLSESLELNDRIHFLGIPFSKIGYHIMVWAIIVVLTGLAVIAILMFIRSNRMTTRIRREFETLRIEYEEHKNKAREKQVKLKRELQTVTNQLNERRS